MEELTELKNLLLLGNVKEALSLVDELEEMSLSDIISEIQSYMIVLLIHLIKQKVEGRTTNSWDVSISNSIRAIKRKNKRRKSGGYYLSTLQMHEAIEEIYLDAVSQASLEVKQGIYNPKELEQHLDKVKIVECAISLIYE